METAFFWIAWGIISFWALKTFYFSFSKDKLEKLRKANIGFTIALVFLYFLPWVPLSLDGWTGFGLAFEGNFLATLFFILLFNSLVLFLQKEYIFLKIASILTILLTLNLFVLMLVVRPGTFILTLYDIAPIIAFFVLLFQIVAVLLLWQQMQLAPKSNAESDRRKKIIIGIFSILITVLGLLLYFYGHSSLNKEQKAGRDRPFIRSKPDSIPLYDAGLVCINNNFSFQASNSYTILAEGKNRLAFVTQGVLVTIVNIDSDPVYQIESTLKQNGTKYTREGELFEFTLSNNDGQAISTAKDTFALSIFYRPPTTRTKAEKIIIELRNTIKGGC